MNNYTHFKQAPQLKWYFRSWVYVHRCSSDYIWWMTQIPFSGCACKMYILTLVCVRTPLRNLKKSTIWGQKIKLAFIVVQGCLGNSLHQVFPASLRNIEETRHQVSAQSVWSHVSATTIFKYFWREAHRPGFMWKKQQKCHPNKYKQNFSFFKQSLSKSFSAFMYKLFNLLWAVILTKSR